VPFTGGSGGAVDTLDVDGRPVEVSVLSMGNPHAVQVVDDGDAAPVTMQGPAARVFDGEWRDTGRAGPR
jgi:diaminopimelate epimerase